jgi:hypothetical protein
VAETATLDSSLPTCSEVRGVNVLIGGLGARGQEIASSTLAGRVLELVDVQPDRDAGEEELELPHDQVRGVLARAPRVAKEGEEAAARWQRQLGLVARQDQPQRWPPARFDHLRRQGGARREEHADARPDDDVRRLAGRLQPDVLLAADVLLAQLDADGADQRADEQRLRGARDHVVGVPPVRPRQAQGGEEEHADERREQEAKQRRRAVLDPHEEHEGGQPQLSRRVEHFPPE